MKISDQDATVLMKLPHSILESKGENVTYGFCYYDAGWGDYEWEIKVDKNKYIVSIFIDGTIEDGNYEYIDEIIFPDGHKIDFDDMQEDKDGRGYCLDFIRYENSLNNYSFEDKSMVEHYLTRAFMKAKEKGN